MMISGSLNNLGPTIDMIWVGKLGPAAIAGVGVSGMVVMLVNTAMMGLYQGMRAMVARSIGAGNFKQANSVAEQAFAISLIYPVAMAIMGIFLAKPILDLFGLQSDVLAEAIPYLRINFIGMVTMSMRMMTESSMQASGDSKRPMNIAIIFRVFHIALSPVLIFGLGFFPRMGVTGAALTGVLSAGIGAAIGLWFLFTGRTRLLLNLRSFRFDGGIMWRIVRIGIPSAVTGMGRTFGTLVLISFLSPFGTLAVAAHTLNQRIEMFINMPQMALGQAAGVLAGQNLGAEQPERAEKTGWVAAGILSVIMLFMSVIIFFSAEYIVRIFNTDPDLVVVASSFLRIACAGWLVLGLTSVFQPCLNGVGDTVIPLLIMILDMWFLEVVLAYFLPRYTTLGVYGVRWAMVSGVATAAITYGIYFKIGRWKRTKV